MTFRPSRSLLAGMDQATLQNALASAQLAYIALSTPGTSPQTVSLGSGEGVTRSVTYRQTDLAQCAALIQLLQAQLGIVRRPRRGLI